MTEASYNGARKGNRRLGGRATGGERGRHKPLVCARDDISRDRANRRPVSLQPGAQIASGTPARLALPAEPSLAFDHEQPIDVAAFALTHFQQYNVIPSMSAALERFFGAEESYAAVKVPLRAQIVTALEKLERVRGSSSANWSLRRTSKRSDSKGK